MKWIVFVLVLVGATYWYFDKKFSPPQNKLEITGEAINVPMVWSDSVHSALLIPVKVDSTLYYMQLDLGSPETLIYGKSGLGEIRTFFLGSAEIHSSDIRTIDYGKAIDSTKVINIIGTIGTDVMEHRTLTLKRI
jgi:hypothetical protein